MECWLSLCIGAAFAASLGAYMHYRTDAALPWLDAALASFSLVASLWAARKRIANWVLWIVLDCVYVGVFISKGCTLLPRSTPASWRLRCTAGAAGKPNRTRTWLAHAEPGAFCARVLLYHRNMHAFHLMALPRSRAFHQRFAA